MRDGPGISVQEGCSEEAAVRADGMGERCCLGRQSSPKAPRPPWASQVEAEGSGEKEPAEGREIPPWARRLNSRMMGAGGSSDAVLHCVLEGVLRAGQGKGSLQILM